MDFRIYLKNSITRRTDGMCIPVQLLNLIKKKKILNSISQKLLYSFQDINYLFKSTSFLKWKVVRYILTSSWNCGKLKNIFWHNEKYKKKFKKFGSNLNITISLWLVRNIKDENVQILFYLKITMLYHLKSSLFYSISF